MADLLLVDEAHRTAGRTGKRAAALHHDEALPARRRLYMTATPKVMTTRGGEGNESALSMDDLDTFGPRLFSYPFANAILDGWLDDYRVVVIGVTRSEVLRILRGVGDTAALELTGASVRTMVVQAALGKAAVEFGLPGQRVQRLHRHPGRHPRESAGTVSAQGPAHRRARRRRPEHQRTPGGTEPAE
jgi:predicted helicase